MHISDLCSTFKNIGLYFVNITLTHISCIFTYVRFSIEGYVLHLKKLVYTLIMYTSWYLIHHLDADNLLKFRGMPLGCMSNYKTMEGKYTQGPLLLVIAYL